MIIFFLEITFECSVPWSKCDDYDKYKKFQVERPLFMIIHKMPCAVMCDPAKP